MEVLKTKVVTEKAAAKLLKKLVDNNKEEENTDQMMNEEVKFQLAQVLAYLEGKKPQIQLQQDEGLYGQY
ncbi:unnamed protein product [Peronospora destructor]|uniref:Uncharacterized protein n=1 Tax=Peronospora destructor TaxID=86335 RepID=A0AAV0VBH9_9STRA|nr:unnamed protein product [Peronospora destructor]